MHSAWMLGGDEGKVRSSSPHSLLALAHAPGVPTQRDMFAEAPSLQKLLPPPPWWPLQQSAKPKISGHIFSMSVCWGWGLLSKIRVMPKRNSPLGTCTQQPRSTLWPWGPLSRRESVGAIHHPTALRPAATGHTAWTKQDRRLIFLSLLDFNWKGICLWLNFLSCLSQSLVDQKKCKLKENILDVPGFIVEHG